LLHPKFGLSPNKKIDFTFWLNFGLSPNFGLSERLMQKVKSPSDNLNADNNNSDGDDDYDALH